MRKVSYQFERDFFLKLGKGETAHTGTNPFVVTHPVERLPTATARLIIIVLLG